MAEMKRASELMGGGADFDADWQLEDVEDDFLLVDFEDVETGFGPAVVVTCQRSDERHRWVTWSGPIRDQVHELADAMPYRARVESRRGDRGWYYTLV